MGSGVYLAKIIGLPGDTVKFNNDSYEIRGKLYPTEQRYYVGNELKNLPIELTNMQWGDKYYDRLSGLTLSIPDDQYLTDEWIGWECLPDKMINGSTAIAKRFTIKAPSIIGVCLMQVGHSWIFENYQGHLIY